MKKPNKKKYNIDKHLLVKYFREFWCDIVLYLQFFHIQDSLNAVSYVESNSLCNVHIVINPLKNIDIIVNPAMGAEWLKQQLS